MDYSYKSKRAEKATNVQEDISFSQVKCPQCKKVNPKWRRFCEKCGKSLKF